MKRADREDTERHPALRPDHQPNPIEDPIMAFPSSIHPEDPCCTALDAEELEQINGGLSITALNGSVVTNALPGLKIRPFSCLTCVQGVPRDLLTNIGINPVLKAPFAGL